MNIFTASGKTIKGKSPSIIKQSPANEKVRRGLLSCGVISSLLYIIANVVTVVMYEGYRVASQTVSELSAIDAPTRSLWVSLMIVYSLLLIAFGWGILQFFGKNRPLRIVGLLLIADAVIGLFWPPMHQRAVLAAGGKTLTDTMHIVFTMVTVQ